MENPDLVFLLSLYCLLGGNVNRFIDCVICNFTVIVYCCSKIYSLLSLDRVLFSFLLFLWIWMLISLEFGYQITVPLTTSHDVIKGTVYKMSPLDVSRLQFAVNFLTLPQVLATVAAVGQTCLGHPRKIIETKI